jgi:mono/diheme cytochrome c family protein
MPRRALPLALLLVTVSSCATSGTSSPSLDMSRYEGRPAVGFYRLVFDEYHSLSRATLERSAVAWKAIATALLLDHRHSDPDLPMSEAGYVRLLTRRYGFVTPTRIANWPAGDPQPAFTRPLGIVQGTIARRLPRVQLEVTNNGCSTCHAAVLYDREGQPTREAWVGLPSSSINLGRYAEEAFAAFDRTTADPEVFLANLRRIFPATTPAELSTLRRFYLPELRKRIDQLKGSIGAFTPYSNGGPGLTNGVATIKFYFGVIDDKHRDPGQVAFTSIPDLAGLRLRTSILWDGVYAPPGWAHTGPVPTGLTAAQRRDAIGAVTSIVTVGTLGVTPDVASGNVPRVREAVGWMFDGYQPPPFPGPVDRPLADRGAAIYQQRCAGCHGRYQEAAGGPRLIEFPNRGVPVEAIGTDPVRARAVGDGAAGLFARTPMGQHLHAEATGAYVAVPLTSLWATAPYLHNGSVPTLWHLMHPEARPARFDVGGHRLDFGKVGIAGSPDASGRYRYPAGYRPWTLPETYDTTTPGRGNRGHEAPFAGLDEEHKQALLEFLKRV